MSGAPPVLMAPRPVMGSAPPPASPSGRRIPADMLVAVLEEAVQGTRSSPSRGGAPRRPAAGTEGEDPALDEAAPDSCEELCKKAARENGEGLRFLRLGEPEEVLRCLFEAQNLLDRAEELRGSTEDAGRRLVVATRAETMNCFGLYHRRAGSHDVAAKTFLEALKLYRATGAGLRTLVAAQLNLASCYLEATDPTAGLRHASAAVELGGQLVSAPDPKASHAGESRADDYAMLAVAYHKVAEAQEALREWGKATFAYTQAYEVLRRGLGPQHHLTRTFEKSRRCPHRSANAPLSMRQPATARRLPNIPSARPRGHSQETQGYQLSSEVLASWPPETATQEEQQWYAMARHFRGHHRSPPTVPGKEPTLESLAAFRSPAASAGPLQQA